MQTLPQKLLDAVKSDDPEAVQELVTEQGVSVEQPLTVRQIRYHRKGHPKRSRNGTNFSFVALSSEEL